MQTADALLYVAIVEQTAFALMWLASSKLGVPRRPAMYWMICSLGPCLTALLMTMRGAGPYSMVHFTAHLIYVISFVLMRRGIQLFLRPMRVTDAEHTFVVLLPAIALLLMNAGYLAPPWGRCTIGAAIGWSLLRASRESYLGMSAHYSRRVARIIAIPLGICGGLYALKASLILIAPDMRLPFPASASPTEASMLLFIPVSVAVQMVIAIMVAQRVIARLQTLSRRDSLTRLLNRRAFERALRHEAARARRFDEPLSLLLIDLDHFKRINDEHGHAAGDALLFAVSRTLKTVARDIDRVARFGGEEFCILLPRTTTAGAKQVAGRVCAAIAGTRVNRTEHALSVTASIGVATSRNKHEPVQRIIERADQSMYRAKAQGRNRFAVDGSDDGIVASRAPEFQRRKTPAKKTAREPTGSGACLSQLPKAHSRMPRNSRVAR